MSFFKTAMIYEAYFHIAPVKWNFWCENTRKTCRNWKIFGAEFLNRVSSVNRPLTTAKDSHLMWVNGLLRLHRRLGFGNSNENRDYAKAVYIFSPPLRYQRQWRGRNCGFFRPSACLTANTTATGGYRITSVRYAVPPSRRCRYYYAIRGVKIHL